MVGLRGTVFPPFVAVIKLSLLQDSSELIRSIGVGGPSQSVGVVMLSSQLIIGTRLFSWDIVRDS